MTFTTDADGGALAWYPALGGAGSDGDAHTVLRHVERAKDGPGRISQIIPGPGQSRPGFFDGAVVAGKLLERGAKGPGLILLIPIVDRIVKMDLRVVTIDVAKQEVMTRDNVPVTVDAVVYFRVVDPVAAVVKVENFWKATSLISQTTLRSVLGQSPLDDLLSQRDVINQKLQEIIDKQTEPWGVKVTAVEVREVALPDSMKRAMAKQAEAERERRAKIIHAEGEFQAAERLSQAGEVIARHPLAYQLRYLQTITEVASDKNSTLVVPIPVELLRPVQEALSKDVSLE